MIAKTMKPTLPPIRTIMTGSRIAVARVIADDLGRVCPAEAGDGLAGSQLAGVDEVGRLAPRLEGELAEAEHLVADEELDEGLLVGLHEARRITKRAPGRPSARSLAWMLPPCALAICRHR